MTTTTKLPVVTRHDNGNGTFRYLIDVLPEFVMKASRTHYTHASAFPVGDTWVVRFHKTEAAAVRASAHPGIARLTIVSDNA